MERRHANEIKEAQPKMVAMPEKQAAKAAKQKPQDDFVVMKFKVPRSEHNHAMGVLGHL